MPQKSFLRIKVSLSLLQLLLPLLLFAPLFSSAQLKSISGVVTDEAGTPISGVSVTVLNGSAGTKTDESGKYTINAAPGATLVFSEVNHETFTLKVGAAASYNVTLKLKNGELSDVVVVGYGRQKKVNMVGAVSMVKIDDKTSSRAVPNVSTALSGLIPGLSVNQNSGMAGRNGASLLIRGLGTVNNSNPLIVVDGVPDVDINRVNINDIESVSVLKDATSASVYGSRAANGVILITTKSGKGASKTAFNVSSTMTLEKPRKAYSFMADYPRALTLEQRRASTNTLPSNLIFKNGTIDQWMALGMIDPLRYPNTDWWDVIMRDGAYQNHNVSASGGNEKSNFYASVGALNELGLQINNDYNQYNARFNFDYKLKSNMNTGVRFSGNWSKFNYALLDGFTDPTSTNTAGFDMQYAIAGITPYDPVSGKFGGVMAYGEDPQAYNPYTLYVNNLNHRDRQEAYTTMYWDWSPIKGLTARVDYSLTYYNQFDWSANMPNQAYNFQNESYGSRVYVGPNAGVSNATRTGYKTLMDGRLNYEKSFGTDHVINALFVYSEEYWFDRYQGASRNDRLYPTLHEIDAALTDIQTTGGNSSTEGLRSYIGRFNYTAFGKYLLEGNMRVDASSKFLPGHQYGYFPSVAVGWRFTEEKFLSKFLPAVLSSGKLRFSYGGLGNNSGIGRYEQKPTLATSNYMINGGITTGFVNGKFVNQDLTWEKTRVFNAGLDLGFFNSRLTAELDYYDRLTIGMVRGSQMSIHLTGAYAAPRTNIGNLRNRGVEASVSWKDKLGDFNYGLTVNASYTRSRLESWSELLTRGANYNGNNIFINMPYDFVYYYQSLGVAQTWQDIYNNTPQGAQPGDILRKDVNGDGRIDGNDQVADFKHSTSLPNTYYSLNAYVAWKGFDLGVLLQGSSGRKDFWLNIFNNPNFNVQRYAATWNHWNNPWSVENRDGIWPRLGGSGNNTSTSTFWLDNMRYLRVKNLQVGYSFPQRWLRLVHANSFRIAGSAENLGTLTSYRGLDPEKAGNNNDMYPIVKSYSLILQLGL